MNPKKWSIAAAAFLLLTLYNGAQPDLYAMRTNPSIVPGTKNKVERYGPSFEWLDRAMGKRSGSARFERETKLDFRILSSMMVAGMASGFRSQVANLLWLKFDEYSHAGQVARQIPIMEAVVTLDPSFIDAWRVSGWHWAYNMYAEVPEKPAYKAKPGQTKAQRKEIGLKIRREQQYVVDLGLDYLFRGANANPDTYAIWFDAAQTRAWKAGIADDETIALYEQARAQKDAREIKTEEMVDGKRVPKTLQGLDVVGHMMAHTYGQRPDIDKALGMWREVLLSKSTTSDSGDASTGSTKPQLTSQDIRGLENVGAYWRRYGSNYGEIINAYSGGDATLKSQIKQAVPDIESLIQASNIRARAGALHPTPTGAYITIVARYLPAWELMKRGQTREAIRDIVGVMNNDPRYTLQGLPAYKRVLELLGDAPQVIDAKVKNVKDIERTASGQDIGLHLLAALYEKLATESAATEKRRFEQLAYEIWYRARLRDALDFLALRKTYAYEDRGFEMPDALIDELAKIRKGNSTNFSPKSPQV